jgi:hypothetical protein
MGGSRKAKRVPWEYGHGSWERLHQGSMGNVKAYSGLSKMFREMVSRSGKIEGTRLRRWASIFEKLA